MASSKSVFPYPGSADKPKVTLGYWAISGLAAAIRLLLAYTETPFDDVRYVQADKEHGFEINAWLEEKAENPNELLMPNLPYLVDGPVRLTQSNAILRHIGRKNGLNGTTEVEMAECDMMIDEAYDFRNALMFVYRDNYQTNFDNFFNKTVPNQLMKLERILEIGERSFIVKNTLTTPDFHWFELLRQIQIMKPGCMDSFPTVLAYWNRIREDSKVKQYLQSTHYFERPLNNKVAHFQ